MNEKFFIFCPGKAGGLMGCGKGYGTVIAECHIQAFRIMGQGRNETGGDYTT